MLIYTVEPSVTDLDTFRARSTKEAVCSWTDKTLVLPVLTQF